MIKNKEQVNLKLKFPSLTPTQNIILAISTSLFLIACKGNFTGNNSSATTNQEINNPKDSNIHGIPFVYPEGTAKSEVLNDRDMNEDFVTLLKKKKFIDFVSKLCISEDIQQGQVNAKRSGSFFELTQSLNKREKLDFYNLLDHVQGNYDNFIGLLEQTIAYVSDDNNFNSILQHSIKSKEGPSSELRTVLDIAASYYTGEYGDSLDINSKTYLISDLQQELQKQKDKRFFILTLKEHLE